jgi:hypothetical protein
MRSQRHPVQGGAARNGQELWIGVQVIEHGAFR